MQSIAGEQGVLGSFDLMVKIYALQNADWKRHHGQEGVIDVKLSGFSEPFGLNSVAMRRHLIKGRSVLLAAKKNRSRIGRCGSECNTVKDLCHKLFRFDDRLHFSIRRPAGRRKVGDASPAFGVCLASFGHPLLR